MSEDTLTHHLLSDKSKRPMILSECEKLVDDEVAGKGGLTGMAIKIAYKAVSAMKPGLVREVLDTALLDDFVTRLEPFYAQHRDLNPSGHQAGPKGFGDFLAKRPGPVADALLGITDERAKRTTNQGLKTAYEKLRPKAKEHVEAAVPR